MNKNSYYITTPIYYPSDKLHIGHAYCTTIADCLARFHRLKGEDVFFLTGSADKGTGTEKRNTFLCRSRAYGIRDILINDYNVKAENIVIKATVISDKHLDGAYDRCVIIEKN